MLVMNAGAYGASLSDIIIDALVYKDGEVKTLKKEEMLLDYRSSIFKDSDYIILSARFKLIKSEENESEKDIADHHSNCHCLNYWFNNGYCSGQFK